MLYLKDRRIASGAPLSHADLACPSPLPCGRWRDPQVVGHGLEFLDGAAETSNLILLHATIEDRQ
jgi:hypothetical protein